MRSFIRGFRNEAKRLYSLCLFSDSVSGLQAIVTHVYFLSSTSFSSILFILFVGKIRSHVSDKNYQCAHFKRDGKRNPYVLYETVINMMSHKNQSNELNRGHRRCWLKLVHLNQLSFFVQQNGGKKDDVLQGINWQLTNLKKIYINRPYINNLHILMNKIK